MLSPSSGPRLTCSRNFIQSDSDMEEGGQKSSRNKEENRTEKPLKRVRKLDDDSDSGREDNSFPFPFQNPSQNSQNGDQNRSSLHQPVTKKMRKWVDSDSDSESSSSSNQDDKTNTSRHEREEEHTRQEVEGGGEASKEFEGGRSGKELESDSEGEGRLEIDLEHQSQSSSGEGEASIRSPVCDTVELLHNEGGIIDSETVEQGSLATLAMY